MPDEIKKRFTAFRLSIGQIHQGSIEFDKENQEKFSRLVLNNKEIVRVNLIATVVDKFINDEGSYASITVDDGTGNIRVKVFSEDVHMLKDIQLGDTLTVIGLLRYFGNELYILPEIVKQVDARWLLARKLELQKEYGETYTKADEVEKAELAKASQIQNAQIQKTKPQTAQPSALSASTEITEEKIEVEKIEIEKIEAEKTEDKTLTVRDQILDIIKAAEPEEGIDVDKIIMTLKAPVDNINSTIIELLEEGSIFEPRPGRLRIL